jgi:hypothetical protein
VVKDLRQVDYEFECEGLADFKYGISPNKETNKELEESLFSTLSKNGSDKHILSMEEALSYVQPRSFTKARNVFSQVKDPDLDIDFFTKALDKHT